MKKLIPTDRYPKKPRNAEYLHSLTGQKVATVQVDPAGARFARKQIDPAKHILRQPPGIAIDAWTLQDAEARGIQYVRCVTTSCGLVLSATLEEFRTLGFDLNRGYGHQIVLGIEHWHRSPIPKPRIPEVPTVPQQPREAHLFDTTEAA